MPGGKSRALFYLPDTSQRKKSRRCSSTLRARKRSCWALPSSASGTVLSDTVFVRIKEQQRNPHGINVLICNTSASVHRVVKFRHTAVSSLCHSIQCSPGHTPRPQTPRPHNQRPVGQPREGAQHIPAGLPSSKQLLTVLTPPNLLFSGPFVNLHKANNTVCPAKLSSIAHI